MFLWYQISWTASRDRVRMEPPVWREPTPSRATARPATPETAATSVCPISSIKIVCVIDLIDLTQNMPLSERNKNSPTMQIQLDSRVVKENKSVLEYFMSGFYLLDFDTIDFTSETH